MAKPLITELVAAGPLCELFGDPERAAAARGELLPEAYRRAAPPALPALDEATVRGHFAEVGCLAASSARVSAAVRHAAAMPALSRLHPRQPAATAQGLLEAAHEVARALAGLTGLDRFSLQPPTLAAAERAALRVAAASFARTEPERTEAVVPAGSPTAAAARDAGLTVRAVPRLQGDDLDVEALAELVGPRTVAVVAGWLTPCGAFERSLFAAGEVAHAHGALLCVDASGAAALAGRTRLREAGADVAWLGLRELCPTASSAAVGVRRPLTEFLPSPLVGKTRSGYELDDELPGTIGPLALAPARFADALDLYLDLRLLGEPGLRQRADRLALQANAGRQGGRRRLR